jgi:hypothetical protein
MKLDIDVIDRVYDTSYYCVDSNSYDGAPDSNEPMGRGDTKLEALTDFFQQLYEREQHSDGELLTELLNALWEFKP